MSPRPLAALPGLLAGEAAIAELLGVDDAIVAVPESARSVVLAALAELSTSPTVLVATATAREAEQLVHDLAPFLGSDAVELLPAWETLPFERVSPATETMGRRLRTMWRLRNGSTGGSMPQPGSGLQHRTGVVVAPIRALLQRLGPRVEDAEPVVVRQGSDLDPEDLVARLVHAGYRREYQVEARGELAVRGGIIDVFGSTASLPIRIDLFGDEVDRLTAFDVADQRSVVPLRAAVLLGCRELVSSEAVRARAAALIDLEPWGRSQWERLAAGESFDGMESWLPWLHPEEQLLTDLLPPTAQVVLVDPRRVRDRAVEVHEEEGALAQTLAATWGVSTPDLPRLHLPFDRLLARSAAAVLSLPPTPDSPRVPVVTVRGIAPAAGDPAHLASQVGELVAQGYSVTLCSAVPAGTERLSAVLGQEGVSAPVHESAVAAPGARVVESSLLLGFVLPESKVAVLSESDVTGRRVPHRRARPRARPADGFFDDLSPGSYVVHRQHGVARFSGVTSRANAM